MGVNSVIPGSRRAVFLDRDGVINRALIKSGKPYPPTSLADVDIPPEVFPGLLKLANAGFLLIVVTNQPDVARGIQSREAVEEIHDYLKAQLPIDEILTCYHDDEDGCLCRKPHPGLLLDAANRLELNLSCCFMIGDRWRDIEAGQRAGVKTIFIDYDYLERKPENSDYRVATFTEAVETVLGNDTERK